LLADRRRAIKMRMRNIVDLHGTCSGGSW